MKINKLIAKGLALGFLLNSLSILSYANTEVPNRYQTIEGEYITIDDSIEGNLEEIEIFGNTVQDANNLEDIQSVGDLYVDKDGNPILDKQGREQYKIDIVSSNYISKPIQKGLVSWVDARDGNVGDTVWYDRTGNNNDFSLIGFSHDGTNGFYQDRLKLTRQKNLKVESSEYVRVLEGESYSLEIFFDGYFVDYLIGLQNYGSSSEKGSFICAFGSTTNYRVAYDCYEPVVNGNFNQEKNHVVLIKDANTDKIRVFLNGNLLYERDIVDGDNGTNQKVQLGSHNNGTLYKSDIDIYSHRRYNKALTEEEVIHNYNYEKFIRGNSERLREKITILIPTQLQKIGNISDRLYWDNSKERYIIEKNISKEPYNLINSVSPFVEYDNHIIYRFHKLSNMKNSSKIYCNRLSSDYNNKTYSIHGDGAYFRIKMPIEINTKELLQNWINEANTLLWYQLEDSELIETNITSKIKVPTYEGKTYVFAETENDINPTLKVVVDRLPKIAKEAVAQAENDNTNHNISLARRYINMLPESSYKDQLQNQLSEIFSSDMVLDMKTATSNLDVYIKSENILQMSLDTNSISFDDFSGIEDMEKLNVVNITINSSLPYQLNAYLPSEIQNSDKTKIMDKEILQLKESSESNYQIFSSTTDKIVLKDNCSAGNHLIHGVDLKLAGGIAHEKDVYKAIIKLEAEQK